MMVEPTESESKQELDHFCDAMLAIKTEIDQIATGQMDKKNNQFKNAPHCSLDIVSDNWDRPYSRELAAFPSPSCKDYKYWPTVSRIDNVYGDRVMLAEKK
jgi:glycine dehydrogenase